MEILYEDNSILVCVKEAGVPTQTAKITEKDMVSEVNNYLKRNNKSNSQAFVIHRLDREVKGVLVFAKTKKAAAALSQQIQDGLMNKHYKAYVEGIISNNDGGYILLENYLGKDSKENKAVVFHNEAVDNADICKASVDITNDAGKAVKLAKLEYKVEKIINDENVTLLDINLLTGRFHQIRAQLSNLGYPIANDIKYGATKNSKYKRFEIGLVAYRLEFIHPDSTKKMEFQLK